MSSKPDAEHVPHFALEPICAYPQGRHRINCRIALLYTNLDPQTGLGAEGEEVVDHVKPGFPSLVIHGCDIYQQIEPRPRVTLQKLHDPLQAVRADHDCGV